jgi:2-oxoisovalerate dehydrogenase E2 component (dihydrolipoyl transacylase)
MARYEFKLPDIGEGIAEAEIVTWHVKVGDMVKEDQQLADMMTDKATVEMESPVAGRVSKWPAKSATDRDRLGAGGVRDEAGAPAAAPSAPQSEGTRPARQASAPTASRSPTAWSRRPRRRSKRFLRLHQTRRPSARPSEVEKPAGSEQRPSTSLGTSEAGAAQSSAKAQVLASPAVRQRARDLGIDLASVKTSSDRVRHADLDAYLLYNGGSVPRTGAAQRQDEVIKIVGLRRKIAENMQEAKRRIPHFTLVEEFDVTALEQTRAMMNADRGGNPKLTMLPFLITAMCRVLPDYPQLNARYDDDAQVLTRSGAVHMGMATQTPNGLMVPVIRNAQSRSIWEIAREILRLAEGARTGKAAREELSGSTITLSSLGPMGGITSTPVINRPEVAIIAVNKVEEKPVVIDGELEIRKRMNLSLSCDHRVVDGWDAANFLQALKGVIESPLKLLSL